MTARMKTVLIVVLLALLWALNVAPAWAAVLRVPLDFAWD
jgi:hypothetical protein